MAGEQMLAVAAAAKAFSLRPSELLGIEDAVVALNFDLAAALVAAREREERPETNRVYL